MRVSKDYDGAMSRKLTKKQKIFADEYIETGNGRRSAFTAYDVETLEVAAVIASENLTKPNVMEYIQSKAELAAGYVFELAREANNEAVRLNASKDILDRAGFKAVEKTQTLVAHVYSGGIDISSLALRAAESLKANRIQDAN